MDRILLVANKSWEADALVGVLKAPAARPSTFPPSEETPPHVEVPLLTSGSRVVPARLAFTSPSARVEVWCIEDLCSSSGSEEKARVLPFVARVAEVSLVFAFGTAAFPSTNSYNGCVVVGCNAFVHNAHPAGSNPNSNWGNVDFEKLIISPTPPVLETLSQQFRANIETRFLASPINPAIPPILAVSEDFVAVSSVNVTNYAEYAWVDNEALEAVKASNVKQPVGSIDTTHGVTRMLFRSSKFAFVSGITDRVGYFNMEVSPRTYTQNFVAAHNAGVAMAWLLPALLS